MTTDSFEVAHQHFYSDFFKGDSAKASDAMNQEIFDYYDAFSSHSATGNILSLVWEWKNQSISLQFLKANDSKYDMDDRDELCIKILYRNQGYDMRKELEHIALKQQEQEALQRRLEAQKEKKRKDSIRIHQNF